MFYHAIGKRIKFSEAFPAFHYNLLFLLMSKKNKRISVTIGASYATKN